MTDEAINQNLTMTSHKASNYDESLITTLHLELISSIQSVVGTSDFVAISFYRLSRGTDDFNGNGPFFGYTFGIDNNLLVLVSMIFVIFCIAYYLIIKGKQK